MNQRIIFLGTPEISATVLEGLVKAGFNIVGVVTNEDKVRSRKKVPEESPVAKKARELGIPVHKPHRLNKDFQFVKDLNPDLLLTFSFGQIISDEVLALSKYTPLNLHGSLLPKYRGASPMQASLFNGDKVTGVTLMAMVHEMDAGDMYAKKEIPLTLADNYTSLCDKMAEASLALAIDSLPLFFENKLIPTKQDASKATFTHMITKEEEHLSLDLNGEAFVNKVRALSFTPGAYLFLGKEYFKIYKAEVYSDKVDHPLGNLFSPAKKTLVLQLKDGQVKLDLLQKQGKKMMKAADFLNGVKNLKEMILR